MKLNIDEFSIQGQRDDRFRIFRKGNMIDVQRNLNGFFTAERAKDWLTDFISSYNNAFENKNISFEDFCKFYLDNTKSQKDKLVELLDKGILKSTDTYGNIIVSKLADYLIDNEVIIKHLL